MSDGLNVNLKVDRDSTGINPILETDRDEDASPNIFSIKGQRQGGDHRR
jgi:hypothetical protein